MRKSNQEKVRVLLREYTDGLTVSQVANITSLTVNNINRSLRNMPDAYIDRWEIRNRGRPLSAVWCVVVPPENCPKPERKPK